MILEAIVTTLSPDGAVNIAPMGPQLDDEPRPGEELRRFTLKPFNTSQTFRNLREHPEGVLHVTDDVLLLARAAIGPVDPLPPLRPARVVRGLVLADACRHYEFRVVASDTTQDRVRLEAEVVAVGRGRDFFGFNRAKHAVLEAAILATRTMFLPPDEIDREYERLAVLVHKTGGAREHEAFELLRRHVAQARQGGTS